MIALVAIAFVFGVLLPTEEEGVFQGKFDSTMSENIENQTQTLNEDLESLDEPSSQSLTSEPQETKIETESLSSDEAIYEILQKSIPPNYVFGNLHHNGLLSGMTVTIIESAEQKASIRFTNQYEGIVKEISLSISPTVVRDLKVGIQDDDGFGNPTGKWLDDSFIITSTDPGLRADTFYFEFGIKVTKDKVYHIVIEPYQNPEPFEIMYVTTFQSNFLGRPLNLEDPDIYSEDLLINSLSYDGSKWVTQDKWPIFVLTYEDGTKDGQPYSLTAPWTIRDSVWVGQTLIPTSDYMVSKIGFVVGKEGNPSAPLLFGIKDSQNNLLAKGKFVEAEHLERFANWVEITLDEPVLFSAGDLYRVFLYSPIPKSDDIYQIYGHEFTYDSQLGFGAERHRLTISHDAGERWAAWNDADALFKFTTVE